MNTSEFSIELFPQINGCEVLISHSFIFYHLFRMLWLESVFFSLVLALSNISFASSNSFVSSGWAWTAGRRATWEAKILVPCSSR